MNTKEFFAALELLEKEKGISKDIIIEAFEHALISAYKKNFNQATNVKVEINEVTGTVKLYQQKTVVEEVTRPQEQISLDEAMRLNPHYQEGDIINFEVTPKDFGRIATQTAKQVVKQRIRQAERDNLFQEFKDREGEIVTGIVVKDDGKHVFVDLGKIEALLPIREIMNPDEIKPNSRIKVYISKIESKNKGPVVYESRKDPNLIKRLFELEVPEIYDGTVEIMSVARDAGDRTKICVASEDENVDPVGACVGPSGQRVQNIVDELNGEKIDIIQFSKDPAVLVANALSPAQVSKVVVDEAKKATVVLVPDNQLSLAIGKRGQNARLAAQLTGWKIDIKPESEADNLGIEL
ncbi:transcription termination factor NusA [Turicibacter sanguinis]|uniref:transcription termination factor NusA n=1 Tax=Turicibacter sanguinis TaxID=154288 RepID=UPI00399AA82A